LNLDADLVIRTKAMRRRNLPAALLVLTIGCAGKIAPVDSGGPSVGPDAATCALFSCAVDCDVADPCAPTSTDVVACNSNADCTSFERPSCGCTSLVYGVNRAALARLYSECPLPPCVEGPPPNPCVDAAVGLYTQDCELSPRGQIVLAACVDHQCRTFEPAAGSE
jgi:hypothetical protein